MLRPAIELNVWPLRLLRQLSKIEMSPMGAVIVIRRKTHPRGAIARRNRSIRNSRRKPKWMVSRGHAVAVVNCQRSDSDPAHVPPVTFHASQVPCRYVEPVVRVTRARRAYRSKGSPSSPHGESRSAVGVAEN